MRTEVTAGQYLDILEEQRLADASPTPSSCARAERVIVYKSAKYSVEAPLADRRAPRRRARRRSSTRCASFGLPLGIAYQLRDDLLGVFGDPRRHRQAERRRPARGQAHDADRHRPRTPRRRASAALLDELLGDPDLDDEQVRMLQSTIRDCGAVDEVERLIADNVARAPSTAARRRAARAIARRRARRAR